MPRTADGSASTSAPHPASARPTPCSTRATAAPSAAPTWSSGSSRPTAGRKTERDARGPRGRAARAGRLPGHGPRGDGPRRDPRPAARRGARRRARPHQRAGQPHEKRWQDVEELLDAGIDVITTVNIQHLESLNDVTEQITGVRQRETVPDHVVRAADQIELVDMSPQALRRRMAHGNIYAAGEDRRRAVELLPRGQPHRAARAGAALARRPGRRRPRALPRPARHRRHLGRPGSASSSRSPAGPRASTLMRRAARIADPPLGRRVAGAVRHASRRTHRDRARPARRARAPRPRSSAARSTRSSATTPAEAILAFARAENATQLVIGASRRGRVSTVLRPGIGERVIAASGDIDVHIVTHDYAGRRIAADPPDNTLGRRRRLTGFAFGVLRPRC